jgi:hypothetical protein
MMFLRHHPYCYPFRLDTLRAENPMTWFPLEPTDADLQPFGVVKVRPTPMPLHDPVLESCAEGQPEQQSDGSWCQTWYTIQNDQGPDQEWQVG